MEELKTIAVRGCRGWDELTTVIEFFGSFISTSRETPIIWNSSDLFTRIQQVRDGGDSTLVTRANGLRSKVEEFCEKEAIVEYAKSLNINTK